MLARVNAGLLLTCATIVTAETALCSCATQAGPAPSGRTGGSTIEVVYLDGGAIEGPATGVSKPRRVAPSTPELGDGTVVSEMVAGAIRLLGLEVERDDFERHVLGSALVPKATLKRAREPAVGDLATSEVVVGVVEVVDGMAVQIVGLRGDGPVTRWVRSPQGLVFMRP